MPNFGEFVTWCVGILFAMCFLIGFASDVERWWKNRKSRSEWQ